MNSELRKAKNLADKYMMLFLLMNEWVKVEQKNKSIAQTIRDEGYQKVVIYGMSYVGQRLYDELFDNGIEIVSCIDKKAGGKYRNAEVTSAESIPVGVDVIIVTPIFYYDEIRSMLEKKSQAKIISVEEIVYSLGESD